MALNSVIRPKSDVSRRCSVPGMDVGSGRIFVVQVARESGVARETGPMPPTQSRPPWPLPRSQIDCRPAGAPRPVLPSHWRLGSLASRKATVSLVPQTTDSTHVSDGQGARLPDTRPSHVHRLPHVRPGRRKPVSQTPGPAYVPRLPDIQPAHVRRLPAAQPGRRPSSSGRPARPTSVVSRPPGPADVPSPDRADLGSAGGVPVRGGGQVRGSVSMVFRVCCRIVTC